MNAHTELRFTIHKTFYFQRGKYKHKFQTKPKFYQIIGSPLLIYHSEFVQNSLDKDS